VSAGILRKDDRAAIHVADRFTARTVKPNASMVYDHRGILNLQETVLPSRFQGEL